MKYIGLSTNLFRFVSTEFSQKPYKCIDFCNVEPYFLYLTCKKYLLGSCIFYLEKMKAFVGKTFDL
jgi:hypothetical protein